MSADKVKGVEKTVNAERMIQNSAPLTDSTYWQTSNEVGLGLLRFLTLSWEHWVMDEVRMLNINL
jgi:hypothetical protein